MSSRQPKLVPTNLPLEDLQMDHRGVKDSRYYCLPPLRYDPSQPVKVSGGGFPFHLVGQGHVVGVFNTWLKAKASLSGYPNASNQGCLSEEECVEVWQRLCVLGIHPHPVDPAFLDPPSASAVAFVNTSPRKSVQSRSTPVKAEGSGNVKREGTPVRAGPADAALLADLKKYCSPIRPQTPSPTKAVRTPSRDEGPYVNFAIRGAGIVSSSAARSEHRYLEMQRRGEEPDLLVTRSFEQASLFALDDDEEELEDGGI